MCALRHGNSSQLLTISASEFTALRDAGESIRPVRGNSGNVTIVGESGTARRQRSAAEAAASAAAETEAAKALHHSVGS